MNRIKVDISYEEFAEKEKELKAEKEYLLTRATVTTMRCPLCGTPLKGRTSGPYGDTLDCKAHIECTDGCGFFHAEGKFYSLYDKGASKALAMQCLIDMVRPYIKVFGSPTEESKNLCSL